MSTPFQNRLVGTVIFAAAAVIFLPDLLDGKKQAYQADFEDIPTAPNVISAPPVKKLPEENFASISKGSIDHQQALNDVFEEQPYNKPVPETESVQEVTLNENVNTNKAESTNKLKVTTLTKEKPIITKSQTTLSTVTHSEEDIHTVKKVKAAEQWVVQLGSFRHEKNVNVLVNKLEKQNYKVQTKPIKTKNGTLTKVYVGPETNKSRLEAQLNDLKVLTGVNGRISKY